MSVANLAILIKATDEASATLRSVGGLTRDLGTHAAGSVGGFVSLSSAMAAGQIAASAFIGVAGGLVNVFSTAVTAASTFESKLSAIQAVSGATKQEMADLSAKALQLGKDTSFSASEAADGIAELSKAGVKVADIMGGAAAASLNLAAAGGVSVAEAAEIASNAMNVFNLKGADMAHVADQIAGAANASAIDVTDYKFALAAAGAVAATVGVGFEDLTTSIAVMGQAGIKGSDAGTSLKTMLLNLGGSSKEARAQMKDLGIITKDGANAFFDASGKAKSMSEIAGVLQTATAGLTEKQKLQALQTMFGTDAIRAAAIMAKAGSQGFDDMAASIGKITAADVAKTRLDNLKGSVEAFKGSAETLAITIGIKLLPTFRAIVERGTALINTLIPLAESIDLTDILEDVGAAIAWVVGLFDRAYNAVGSLADEFEGAEDTIGFFINRALMMLTHELGAVASLLNGEGADAAYHFSYAIDYAGDILATVQIIVMDFVDDAIMPLVWWLKDKLPPVISWLINSGWPLLLGALRTVTNFVTGTVFPAIGRLVDWLGDTLPPVLNWLINTGWPALLGAVRTVANFVTGTVVPAITTLIGWLADRVPPAVNAVLTAFQAVAGHLTPIVQAIFGGDLSAALAGLGSAFAAFATLALGWLGAQAARIDWQAVWARAVNVASTMAQWFVSVASLLAGWIGAQVARIDWAEVWDRAVSVAAKMAAWFTNLASQVAEWVGAQVARIDWAGVWSRAVDVAAKMGAWFTSAATLIAGWLGEKIATIDWANVWAQAVDVAAKMAGWFSEVASLFAGWISEKIATIDWGELWAQAVDVAAKMGQWFESVATDFAGWISEKVAEIDWAEVWAKAVEVSAHMAQWFTDTATKFATWLGENVAAIDWAGVWASAVSAATSFTTWMTDTIAAMNWTAIGEYIGALLVWAAVESIKAVVGLATAMATWIGDSITAAFNGDAANGPAGKFLIALGGMITSVGTAVGDLLLGMIRGAWNAAMGQFQPTMSNVSVGGSTQPQSGNGSSGATINLSNPVGGGASSSSFPPIDNSSRTAFVKTAWPYMLEAAGGDRDLAEMMLAKAISENGDVGKGGSFIGNNFSGIKGKGSAGSFTAQTWEMIGGKRVVMDQEFAAYKTPQEGFAAFMNFLKDNPRYKDALAQYKAGGGAEQLFRGINNAGYATDPNWAETVAGIRRNQVAPHTGGLAGTTSSTQQQSVPVQTAQIREQAAAVKEVTVATVEWHDVIPDVDAAIASVTATLQGQFASLQATGTADRDLTRDTLPLINMLERNGAISGETATQLRSMAIAILDTGTATTDVKPDIVTGANAMDAFGATIGVATENLEDLSSTADVNVIDPNVDTQQVDDLAESANLAKTALLASDDVPVSPVVNSQALDAAKMAAQAYANALASSDDTVITPQVNGAAIASGTLAAQGLGTAIQGSDDVASIPQVQTGNVSAAQGVITGMQTALLGSDDIAAQPQVYTNGANGVDNANTKILGMQTTLLGSDDVPVLPQVYTNGANGVEAASTKILGMQGDLLASDNVPALPQVYTNGANGVEAASTAITGMQTALDTSDATPSVPQVYTNGANGVEAATSKVAALGAELAAIAAVHALTFSGNVPTAVTVAQLTGTDTDLNGVGTVNASEVTVNNDVRVQDNLGVANNLVARTSIINPNYTFPFAEGGRPPLGVASLVGELGPELFVPDQAGTIIPAGMTASILSGRGSRVSVGAVGETGSGGRVVVLNVTVTGNTLLGEDRQIARDLADILAPELDRRISSFTGPTDI